MPGSRGAGVSPRLSRFVFRLGSAILGLVWACRVQAVEGALSLAAPAARPSLLSALVSKRHLAYAVIGASATWLAYEHENAAAVARALERSPADEVGGDFGNAYGNAMTLAAGTGAMWIVGNVAGSTTMTHAAGELTRGLLIDSAVVGALKLAVNRERPNGGAYSFPSGHASNAFTVAPIVWNEFGWKAGAAASVGALATAFGRLEDHWHYPSDVIAGATIGLIVGESVASTSKSASLLRSIRVQGRGVGFQVQF